jgi:hypothetical protein
MTKGQEIAKQIWAVPVTQLTEPDAAAAIDAAIDAAVSKRTVECASLAESDKPIQRAILALNTPAPAYPFGLDASGKQCTDWEFDGDHWWNRIGDYPHDIDAHFTHCPFCGAPRTKGN